MSDNGNSKERRQSARTSVMLVATVRRGDTSVPVRLTNVSSTGASIGGGALPLPYFSLELRRKELTIRGRLVWVRGELGGFHFDDGVNVTNLLRPVPAARPAFAPSCRRPPLKAGPASPLEALSFERCADLLGVHRWARAVPRESF